ncbi:arylsulfatase [Gayadomonas joobiniege]|uniref:arylsulfatase n=1 Tax=Gayadomonas joobiniege TaxID=1234606 RepID=UPI00036569F1|nr:arylsulfatase [Gayadomonas joobiniege]
MQIKSKLAVTLLAFWLPLTVVAASQDKPNIVLVMTDDQGAGDIGFNQNPIIETPNLDQLAQQSTRLTNFHVDPTCSPTRAALLTGKHSLKAGVWHTILGRYMLGPEHQTLAEALKQAGYSTAIFGKWHLGDNYPYRPQDQGFDQAVIHGGGGVGQTPDYWGNTQFDDVYYRNGEPEFFSGYATKVWFDEAIKYISQKRQQPHFAYIALNAPHGPYRAPEPYIKRYQDKGLHYDDAAFYGMISYIDEQVARLRQTIKNNGQEDNTIFIYMTDNGSSMRALRGQKLTTRAEKMQQQYPNWVPNNGRRGFKGEVYEGGHRVPFLIFYPNGQLAGGEIDALTAHYDVLPTLLDMVGGPSPAADVDGRSLKTLLQKGQDEKLQGRSVIVTNQRVYHPDIKRPTVVMRDQWRYIAFNNKKALYDIQSDPKQQVNLLESNDANIKAIAGELNYEQQNWFAQLAKLGFKDRYIHVGNSAEDPVRLNAMDWMEVPDKQPVPWFIGHQPNVPEYDYVHWLGKEDKFSALPWYINIEQAGEYKIRAYYHDKPAATPVNTRYCVIKLADKVYSSPIYGRASYCEVKINAKAGKQKVTAWFTNDLATQKEEKAAFYLYLDYQGK